MGRGLFVTLLILLSVNASIGQARDRYGLLTRFNLNAQIQSSWKWNTALESRQIFQEVFRNPDDRSAYTYERTDWTNVFSRRIGLTGAGAMGYMLRRIGKDWVHRSLQQYAWTRKDDAIRWGHRFRADQTWRKEEELTWRFRYRLSVDFPLSGKRLDANEWYLKASTEYIPIIQAQNWFFEGRINIAMGYYLTDGNKFEIGWDGRGTGIFQTTDYQGWLTLTWYYSI